MNSNHLLGRTLVGLVALGVVSSSMAQDSRLVVKTFQSGQGAAVAQAYGLRLLGTSVDGKRALLDARSTTLGSMYKYILSSDPSVEAVDQNKLLNLGSQSGKGSTIPVISVDPMVDTVNTGIISLMGDTNVPSTRTVKVAVLDTGLASGSVLWAKTVASKNFVTPNAAAFDAASTVDSDGDGIRNESLGHGSMVSSLVSMMAPDARLVVVKVADSDGMATTWNLLNGIDYALSQGAEVINISMGSSFETTVFSDVANRAEAQGANIVAAIGNTRSPYALFPASSPLTICVSGYDENLVKNVDANWSTRCTVSAPVSGYAVQPDGTLGTWQGTSFSSGLVAGAIAKVLAGTSPVAPAMVRTNIQSSGLNLDITNPDFSGQMGTGLDVEAFADSILP